MFSSEDNPRAAVIPDSHKTKPGEKQLHLNPETDDSSPVTTDLQPGMDGVCKGAWESGKEGRGLSQCNSVVQKENGKLWTIMEEESSCIFLFSHRENQEKVSCGVSIVYIGKVSLHSHLFAYGPCHHLPASEPAPLKTSNVQRMARGCIYTMRKNCLLLAFVFCRLCKCALFCLLYQGSWTRLLVNDLVFHFEWTEHKVQTAPEFLRKRMPRVGADIRLSSFHPKQFVARLLRAHDMTLKPSAAGGFAQLSLALME
ncbi:hypothetical protein WISP_137769 [Willisornis vidua]|uniref:Uncharacterized protein n=1 Tax=Willisornis vidua TaxID=1566151 RepID=A0ABQ9CTN7_9PASS|nr:hypothetical protein WISP_137769 [Willisornis vidua]